MSETEIFPRPKTKFFTKPRPKLQDSRQKLIQDSRQKINFILLKINFNHQKWNVRKVKVPRPRVSDISRNSYIPSALLQAQQ